MNREEKYFKSVLEFSKHWTDANAQKRMITLRFVTKPVLFKYLEEIVLDDPSVLIDEVDIFRKARAALRKSILASECPAKLQIRKCEGCYCRDNYLNRWSAKDLIKMFYPVEKKRHQ